MEKIQRLALKLAEHNELGKRDMSLENKIRKDNLHKKQTRGAKKLKEKEWDLEVTGMESTDHPCLPLDMTGEEWNQV